MNVEGKVAVITGAASGIGRGMAESFASAGMKVVLSDVEAAALATTAQALRDTGADVHAVTTDVSRPDQVDALADATLRKYGAVHVLCNNAGVTCGTMPSWTSTLDDWTWILGVNLMGVVHGLRTFLPIMIKQGTDAHIVNTSSIAGLMPSDGTMLYAATKAAVIAVSESTSLELQRAGLRPRISVLCPGFVDTRILDSSRNRPAELADEAVPPTGPVADAIHDWLVEEVRAGLRPRAVGDQVLAAIREGGPFCILTHPEYKEAIEKRMQRILDGRDPELPPLPSSLMQKVTESLARAR